MTALSSPRLRAFTRRPVPVRDAERRSRTETDHARCELCAEHVREDHRHLLDLTERALLCACQACSVLFDDQAAGGRHYRLVPRRRRRLPGLRLDGTLWAGLGVPVDLAFFVAESATAGATDGTAGGTAAGITARYPSPAGTIQHTVAADSWQRLLDANPVLNGQQPDTEALVVHRARGAAEHWLLPLDDCYRLTALLREHWTGFSGGDEVWDRVSDFFSTFSTSSTLSTTEQTREAP